MKHFLRGLAGALPAVAVLCLAGPAFAGGGTMILGDPEAGRVLAEENCAGCHAIGAVGESPAKDAPPMRRFHENWPIETLGEALAEGMVVGHSKPQMPAFQFLPEDIDDLLAYIERLSN